MVTQRRIRLEILDIILLHHEQPGLGLVDVKSLADRLGEPKHIVRSACDALESGGFVEKVLPTDDSNPSYSITRYGVAYLRILA